MMRRAFVTTAMAGAVSLSAATAGLAAGDTLPELRGEYLSGRKASLPRDCSGKVTLLLLGFTYQSRFAVEEWAKHFREEFGKTPAVTFYEVPMIGGMARMAKWFIDSGMRRGTAKSDYENVITVYGGIDPWKQRLEVKDDTLAYLVLLDRTGRIVWTHSGHYDDAAYKQLSEQVREQVN